MEDEASFPQSCSDTTSRRCEAQGKRQRRYPRVNPIRWIKKDKKWKSRLSRSSRRISRSSEEKKTLSEDYRVQTSPERSSCASSTCTALDSASNRQNELLPDKPFVNFQGSKDLRCEEGSDQGSSAEPSHYLGEALDSSEKQEEVPEGGSLSSRSRFTAGMTTCGKPAETSHLPPNGDCSHEECEVDLGLDFDTVDFKDVPASETTDILTEATSESPSKMETPKTETVKEERRSPAAKKRASHHKKDRHVKFSQVVTMILIEQHSEERTGESLEGGEKLWSRRLPMCNNVSEEDKKKKAEKCRTGRDTTEDRTSPGQAALPRIVEGTRQPRKRTTVSRCQAKEVKSWCPDTAKCSKLRIVGGMGTSQCPSELEALFPTKETIKERHELLGVAMNECSNVKSEVTKVDMCSGPPQPNTFPNSHEQKLVKSYPCSNCGNISHWSKLSVHQKEKIERSAAHLCGRPACSATAPAQTIHSPSCTTDLGSGETSQPVNGSKKIPASAQPDPERVISAEKTKGRRKNWRNEKTREKPASLVSANDQRTGADSDHCQKPPHVSQEDNQSNVCSKCRDPSANHTSTAGTAAPRPRKSRIRPGNETSKFPAEQPGKTGDSKEHEVCTKCGECIITEHRNDPSSSDQQKKPTKSPGALQKTQDHPETRSTYGRNSRCIVDPENPKSDQDCTKCGKSLAKRVNPETPAEGDEKTCVPHPKKKRKRALEGMEPFQCKQCGKIFSRHFTLLQHRTVHTGERPYSCRECGKTFRDGGYLKVHMRLHTKEKPYRCSECGKSFGQSSALVSHLRTHTDERPFPCSECGKSFSDRSTFRHHQMIHTGEKPFTCSFCGKRFTQQAHVRRHERVHTGERPFPCTLCEKRFVERTKLRKHELTHRRGKVREPKY